MPKVVDYNEQYIKDRISVMDNGCWIWQLSIRSTGYGAMSRGRSAHRVSYEIFKGAIPSQMLVCHTCDNTKCVNSNHLFLGTHSDNRLDAIQKGLIDSIASSKHANSFKQRRT